MSTMDPAGARDELDDLDQEILRELRWMWEAVDPVPPDLVERVRFAIELEDVDVEVLRVTEERELAGVRGDYNSRLITFDSESITIMVNIRSNVDGSLRVDGWLTPPGVHSVELRTPSGPLVTSSTEEGRFALDRIPSGMVQFVVRPNGRSRAVSTPTMTL